MLFSFLRVFFGGIIDYSQSLILSKDPQVRALFGAGGLPG